MKLDRYGLFSSLLFWGLVLVLGGCNPEPGEIRVYFVRGGLGVETECPLAVTVYGADGPLVRWEPKQGGDRVKKLGPGKWLVRLGWQPADRLKVEIKTAETTLAREMAAPQKPSPFLISTLKLEEVRPYGGHAGVNPDTVLKFSPDNRYLAIGSFNGYLRILEVSGGRMILKKKIAEGMVKRLAWSPDRNRPVLFVGEQSPDGFVTCLEAENGREIWRYRLADDIGAANIGPDEGRFGVYNLPGAYQLTALPGGDLLAVGTHGWFKGDDYVYLFRIYRLNGQTGRPVWKWPRDRCLPYGTTCLGSSADGRILAFFTSTWRPVKNPDPEYPNGSLYCLDSRDGDLLWNYTVSPLSPYYGSANAWKGVSVSPDGDHAEVSLYDGRVFFFRTRPQNPSGETGPAGIAPLWVRGPGAPVVVGDIPVAAQASYSKMNENQIVVALPTTSVPHSVAGSQNRTPAPHPHSHYLFAYDFDGNILWQWPAQGSPQGLAFSPDGRWLALGLAEDRGRMELDCFGLALFDLQAGPDSPEKFQYIFPTNGPLFHDLDFSPDGNLLALTEMPLSLDEGKTVYGRYQVHVIH